MSDTADPHRTVLVTGAGRGIGLATARAFAAGGHRVAGCYSSTPFEVEGVLALHCDLSVPGAAAGLVEHVEADLGPVEVLVANAGITRDGLLVRMADRDIDDVLATNLTANLALAHAVVPRMMRARWGRLVFVSSVGAFVGAAGQANYGASKAGLVGLARALAREYGARGITANVVAPGPIDTDMLAAVSETRRAELAAAVPAGRLGTAQEVAAAIRFIASEGSGYLNGVVLPVDGGLSMGL